MKIIYILTTCLLLAGCNTHTTEKSLLKQQIVINSDRQELLNRKELEDWKRVTYNKWYVEQGDSALQILQKAKSDVYRETAFDDSAIYTVMNIIKRKWKHLRIPLDTSFMGKALIFSEKMTRFSYLSQLALYLTNQNEFHCGGEFFDFGLQHFPLPSHTNTQRILLLHYNPVELQKGVVTFYQKSRIKITFTIPTDTLNDHVWTIAVHKTQKPVVVEWADSSSFSQQTRHFTWPDYTGY